MLEKETTIEHFEKYQQMKEKLHLGISNHESFLGRDRETIIKLFKKDSNLNNIRLAQWDSLAARYKNYHPELCNGLSLEEFVCVYKHLCIYDFIGAIPKFVDETDSVS